MCRCCKKVLNRFDASEIKMVCMRCHNEMNRYWLLMHTQPETVEDERFFIKYTDKLHRNFKKGWYIPPWFNSIRET